MIHQCLHSPILFFPKYLPFYLEIKSKYTPVALNINRIE